MDNVRNYNVLSRSTGADVALDVSADAIADASSWVDPFGGTTALTVVS